MNKYKSIFLDRDGVINTERPNDYVKNIDEFEFCEGALEALNILSRLFDNIFVVTNQRGIGRSIMTEEHLSQIHDYMTDKIIESGGRIDRIFYCIDIDNNSINRKPNIGMAFKAKEEFPSINFSESIMVGNSKSDILFGNKLGMKTILVGDKYPKEDTIYTSANLYYQNLHIFAEQLNKGFQ